MKTDKKAKFKTAPLPPFKNESVSERLKICVAVAFSTE